MTLHRHPLARAEARRLVEDHDGRAEALVETALDVKLGQHDIEAALQLDQVRREIERIYEEEGE